MYALNLAKLLFVSLAQPFKLALVTRFSSLQLLPAILQFLLQSAVLGLVVSDELLEVFMFAL